MAKYLKLFETHTNYETFINGNDVVKPNVSYCLDVKDVHFNPHTWADEYLTFVALEDGTISFDIWKTMGTDMITSISYSTDNGETWTTTNNTNNKQANLQITVNVQTGDKVLWKGDAEQLGFFDEDDYGDYVGSFFSSTCSFDAMGNVMSLIYGDDFVGETTIENSACFTCLFSDYDGEKSCGIANVNNLALPATTLSDACYSSMFLDCTSLTSAPQLPATTLTEYCYGGMFYNCTSLTTAPQLPATTLADACYMDMFRGCTSLTSAPQLPATTLEYNCYRDMFAGCTNLTTAPELLATTLAQHCYYKMFYNCTSLTTAPQLPATALTQYCYSNMFEGCTNLNYIKAMFTTTPSTTYTLNWVDGVAANGTFVKNSAAQWDVSGANGIPTGWTVQTASA